MSPRQAYHTPTGAGIAGSGPFHWQEEINMLWTIIVILLVLWLLGLVSSYTLGGFIHALLVIAVIVFIINLIVRRR